MRLIRDSLTYCSQHLPQAGTIQICGYHIRHAGATQVTVQLQAGNGEVRLRVDDNGRGISKAEIFNRKSMGLLGMRERATLLGGAFKIGRLPRGYGTRVTVTIPLSSPPPLHASTHENSLNRRSRRGAPRLEANSGR